MKDRLALGTTLFAIHSFASFLTFLYCHINTESQAVFAYFLFFVVDAPTVPWAFEIEGRIGVLSHLADMWTGLWYYGHQGVNLRAFILTATFGGLHWFAIGNLLTYLFGRIHHRLQRRPMSSTIRFA
ncbi:MAG: hypothetical protein NHB36_08915 [Nitrospira sp.]|nr:hypothetical protein [Nitrospira sp.]